MRAVPYILILCCILNVVSCAKRGGIYGGPMDTIPPVFLGSEPKNLTTNFTANEIKLRFDEYVRIKDVNKQVFVSPPTATRPSITPGNATRELTIRFSDTLKENTTYTINFGSSIQDNNEGNPLQDFKYVFSTGPDIDTLTVVGRIKDALERKPDNFVTLILYAADENFSDSLVYKQKPLYITNTLDSLKTFAIDFVKEGNYHLYALKDKNNNYQYDPKTDKIGFLKSSISLPTDTIYEIELFKEVVPLKPVKPMYENKRKILVGYEGNFEELAIKGKYNTEILDLPITRINNKDSMYVWVPSQVKDSISLQIKEQNYSVRIKNEPADTLKITAFGSATLSMRNHYKFTANNPISRVDERQIEVISLPDSTKVPFKIAQYPLQLTYNVEFEKKTESKYAITVLPNAFVDMYGFTNDTLRTSFGTKAAQDYSNLTIQVQGYKPGQQLIGQIVDESGRVKAEEIVTANTIEFKYIEPTIAYFRVIVDENKNGIWDAGNLIERRYSEPVYYIEKPLELRANWDIFQPFILPE